MKKLLLSVILIIGCSTEPEDCAGVAGGTAVDDCAGICGGTAVLSGCDNQCNSTAVVDECGVCDIDSTNDCTQDCNGDYDGTAVLDDCNDCVGGNTEFEPNYAKDDCGVCGGNGIAEGKCDCDGNIEDCTGECGGDAIDDDDDGICDILQGTVTDIDGNIYETVQIGQQKWMAENLKVTHYNNGDEIPSGYTTSEDWSNLTTGGYVVYPTVATCEGNCANVYGNLYNWYAVDDDRGVCPEGYHIPSDDEFMELEMYLGMSEEEANSIGYRGTDESSKLAGNSDLWIDGDLENNSEFGTSGFNGLPAGYRAIYIGGYKNMGNSGFFWSSSEYGSNYAWFRSLRYNMLNVQRYEDYKHDGFSIRCLGD